MGAGPTFVAALQHGRIACGMTTQPTAGAIQTQGIGTSVINLATTGGAQQWLGGAYPAAGVLARADWVASHQAVVQKVVDALVATMHWISMHSAADIANAMPPAFVSNGLTTKAAYVAELAQDKGQFLPNGMMPDRGRPTVLAINETGNSSPARSTSSAPTPTSTPIAANKLAKASPANPPALGRPARASAWSSATCANHGDASADSAGAS